MKTKLIGNRPPSKSLSVKRETKKKAGGLFVLWTHKIIDCNRLKTEKKVKRLPASCVCECTCAFLGMWKGPLWCDRQLQSLHTLKKHSSSNTMPMPQRKNKKQNKNSSHATKRDLQLNSRGSKTHTWVAEQNKGPHGKHTFTLGWGMGGGGHVRGP